MSVVLIVVLSILGVLLILLFIGLSILYNTTFYSPKKWQNNDFNLNGPFYKGFEDQVIPLINSIRAIKYDEDIYITSFDKLKLHARVYLNPSSNKVAIMCHGYRGTPCRDFSGGAVEMIKLGYNVILIDERAHGQSQGHSITFGVRETKDVVGWVNYARNRFGENIELVLVGISMGGATVLMSADKVGKAKIIADCPYSSPRIMLQQTIRAMGLPVRIFYPLVNLSSILFAHTNLNKISPYDSIKNTTNPVLIIHGGSDSVVPNWISNDLYLEYPDKIQYELFPGADHGMSYLIDKPRYQKVIVDFLNKK